MPRRVVYGKETGMKDFLFKSPTKVKFGAGISFQLYEIFEEMGAKKPFIVTGKHVGKTDEFAKIIASLEEKGYSVQLFTDTQPVPAAKFRRRAS